MENATKFEKPERLEVLETVTPQAENSKSAPKDPDLMTPEEQAAIYKESALKINGQITEYSNSIEGTIEQCNDIRDELGIPETNDIPPSVDSTVNKLEASKNKLAEVEGKLAELENQGAVVTDIKEKDHSGTATGNTEDKRIGNAQPEIKQSPSEKQEIPEATLAQLSESLKIKNELQERVGVLKTSPEFQAFQKASQELGDKQKKLDELKNSDKSTNINIGSVSIGGGNSVNINIEGSESSKSETVEESEIDLAEEAKNLLTKVQIDILKLQKEEMEYSTEGLNIKTGEIKLETTKIDAETEIWSSGGMDQRKFAENMQKVNDPERGREDFDNKELFLKFKTAYTEVENYKSQNQNYHQRIDDKQREIDEMENTAGNLECPNENRILELLDKSDKAEETGIDKTDEMENIDTTAEKTETEDAVKEDTEDNTLISANKGNDKI